jgi:hypothetical protein
MSSLLGFCSGIMEKAEKYYKVSPPLQPSTSPNSRKQESTFKSSYDYRIQLQSTEHVTAFFILQQQNSLATHHQDVSPPTH